MVVARPTFTPVGLGTVEKPACTAGIAIGVHGRGLVGHIAVIAAVFAPTGLAFLTGLHHAAFERAGLLIEQLGGLFVQQQIGRPAAEFLGLADGLPLGRLKRFLTRFGDAQISADDARTFCRIGLGHVQDFVAKRNAAGVDVHARNAPLHSVPGECAVQRFHRQDDRLPCGLQCRAPAVPNRGIRRGWSRDGDAQAKRAGRSKAAVFRLGGVDFGVAAFDAVDGSRFSDDFSFGTRRLVDCLRDVQRFRKSLPVKPHEAVSNVPSSIFDRTGQTVVSSSAAERQQQSPWLAHTGDGLPIGLAGNVVIPAILKETDSVGRIGGHAVHRRLGQLRQHVEQIAVVE